MARFSGSDRWRRHRALTHPFRGLASGKAGSEARLEVLRGGDTLAVTMVRDAEGSPEEPRPEDFTEVAEGVVYVNLDRASWSAIREHLRELADARGVVFDLRGYPNRNHQVLSHLSDSTLQSAHWNVPRIIYPDRRGPVGWDTRGRWALEPREPRIAGEVVFLTDGRAISYAESVLGIVEAYELGEIVGRPTAGANGNVNPLRLPGGYTLSWTGMKVLKHDSTRHHLVGIRPTVPVERTVEAIRDGRDEYLETALELILGRERR
jgi:C-terminal processing protease CtpA/Prc